MPGTIAPGCGPTEPELSELVAQLRAVCVAETLEMTLHAGTRALDRGRQLLPRFVNAIDILLPSGLGSGRPPLRRRLPLTCNLHEPGH